MGEVFRSYGVPAPATLEAVRAIGVDGMAWVDFMMRFELGLEAPDPDRARTIALTTALS